MITHWSFCYDGSSRVESWESGLNLLFLAALVHISLDRCTPCIVLLRLNFIAILSLRAQCFCSCGLDVAMEHTGFYLHQQQLCKKKNSTCPTKFRAWLFCTGALVFWQDQSDRVPLLAAVFSRLCLGRRGPIKRLIMRPYKVCVYIAHTLLALIIVCMC